MDPNTALTEIRELVALAKGDVCCAEHGEMAGTELAMKFEALDEWLTKGGFPPEVWVH